MRRIARSSSHSRHSLGLCGLLLLAPALACSPVYHVVVRPDFAKVDKTKTIHLAVVTAPLPDGLQPVGDLWSEIAEHYANDQRDFIVKTAKAAVRVPADICAPGIDGVLHLTPQVWREGPRVRATALATLTRCSDGQVIWSAMSGGEWKSAEKAYVDLIQHYTQEYGPAVKPYVSPSFLLLKATLDTLPRPNIQGNPSLVDEKIESTD